MNIDEQMLSVLRGLVQRFRVCWKTWPECTYVDGEKRQIGYAVELAGTPEPWIRETEPGTEDSQRVYQALEKLAEWITLSRVPSFSQPHCWRRLLCSARTHSASFAGILGS